MACCVRVSTETVLQVVTFYTVVKKNLEKIVVSDCTPSSEDYSPKGLFFFFKKKNIFQYGVKCKYV